MSGEEVAVGATRTRACGGLFRLDHAGLITVRGEDRTIWLNGMISNDVAALSPGRDRSGCHAALLTNRGAIIADLHVVDLGEMLWVLVERAAAGAAIGALDKFIVADDVTLADESGDHVQWAVEGPEGSRLFDALGIDAQLAPGAGTQVEIAGHPVMLVARGVSGEWARQLIAASGVADAVAAALESAGADVGIGLERAATLETLRVEAGTPRQGAELDDDVLPDEARLDAAISTTKGCYVGQEIVARLRSRGSVNHLLVGLRFESGLPEPGEAIQVGDKRTGEVTSVAASPACGDIGLGYVRRAHSEAGTVVEVAGHRASVAALPFVTPAPSPGEAGS